MSKILSLLLFLGYAWADSSAAVSEFYTGEAQQRPTQKTMPRLLSVKGSARRLSNDSNGSYGYGYGGYEPGAGFAEATSGYSTMSWGGYGGYSGSNSSYGYGVSTTYNYNNSYGWSGGYGSGGYTDWLYCEEAWCQKTVYNSNGEVDWDATYKAEQYCATWTEGCKCIEEWEFSCESYGYKVCQPKSYGPCWDPFNVTCNSETETKCQDDYSAYCWDKSWGECPVTCSMDEDYCFSYQYDAITGERNWSAPMTEFCANRSTGCPCDLQWEDKCVDNVYNYSWCTPKTDPCPISCAADEQLCYGTAYYDNGEPNWMVSGNQTCVKMGETCPCNTQHEVLCNTTWGTYCQATYYGQCPISCAADEIYCTAVAYDEFGYENWSAPYQESCAAAKDGCPCNQQWEKRCTEGEWSWCVPHYMSCPVDCGDKTTCWHWSGNQTCGTDTGCVCESEELTCPDAAGVNECYPKVYYPDGCPLNCNYDTHTYCYEVGYDASGFMTWTEYCKEKTSPDDWDCPVICKNETSKKCGDGWDAYCVGLTDTCPEVCTSEQQLCWVTDYDASGNWLGGADQCHPANEDCPCGSNSQLCSFDGYSYCESTFYGCPVTCTADQKYCYPVSYTPEGEWDYSVPVQETCAGLDETCECGANAKMCKWTDEWGWEEEYCMPSAWECPVTCTAEQKRCYLTDYNASGYPEKYSEKCVGKEESCRCGTHSQKCYDPYFDEDYCYPLVDFWSGQKMNCPVYCKDNEDYCYIPSYDARGDWISFTEMCVPQGTPCDCSKGQNAFACTWNDPTWGSWTECLPTSGPGSYCPSDCPQGEVACDLVEDYLPNGTSLGFVTPSVKCAKSHDKCPCGKEAERCPGTGCIFKDEGCPVTCGADEKKCYLTDYTGNGEFISDRETCVAADATCPCGKNTAKCANTDLCLTTAEAAIVCPCKASETECLVVDYDKNGEATGFSTQCVKEGQSCPCGKNTLSCPDPNDALAKLCAPSFNTKKCPEPCTADAIAAGNVTCVQTNLNSNGKFKSETVTCIGANATCPAGEGMKKCLSGATISVDTTCMNLYATATTQNRRLDSSTATRETCNAIVTMSSLSADAKKNAETARVKINSVLQIPSGLKTTLAVKTATRRLKEQERALNSGGTVIYGIDNQGVATSVSPSQVCEQLKKMVKSSNPSLTKAVSTVGVINAQAGVNLEISSTALQSRSQAAKAAKAAQAGVTTRSTTTTVPQADDSTTTTTTADASGGNPSTSTSTSGASDGDSSTSGSTSEAPNTSSSGPVEGSGTSNGAMGIRHLSLLALLSWLTWA